jgi:hypothetical protein
VILGGFLGVFIGALDLGDGVAGENITAEKIQDDSSEAIEKG